jgi:molybdate transport system ATP-binding protein
MASTMASNDEVFRIDSVTIARPGGEVVFDRLSWTMREGETWAITGATGSGKTSLTEILSGRLRVTAGTITWPLVDRLRASGRAINWPSEIVERVAFKEESRLFSYSRHYYQQRYNFIEPDDDLTLDQFLTADTPASEEAIERVTTRLGIADLRALSLIKLSNGQTRRARIARALLSHPEILILDEPFVGLDAAGRQEVHELLKPMARDGTRLIVVTSLEAVPDWTSHVVELTAGRVSYVGRRKGYASCVTPQAVTRQAGEQVNTLAQPVVEMRGVNVTHGGKPILRDISWTVRAGERWALLGPNGSGKTTLLSLICGDHPQAYSNDVSVFGVRRGGGESIWDVKRRIGLVSPEMHLYFSEPMSAQQTAATGFFDVLVPRTPTPEQDLAVKTLFDYFGVSSLAARPFGQLSSGQQRTVLLIRALVKNPPLLILDEPFQVLDAMTANRAREWIDERLPSDRTVLFVTHNEAELPRTVSRKLRLLEGMVVPP